MAFKLKFVPEITLDVEISVPGESAKSTIVVTYKIRPVSEQERIFKATHADKPSNADIMIEDIIHIDGVKDVDGEPLAFNKDILEQLMEIPYVMTALVQGWFKAQAGLQEAKRKN